MKLRNRKGPAGFTLLELVVVLAILAVVTALATRALSTLEDQRRFEATQRGLAELDAAVLGSPNDRAPDGSQIASGFVADMGRLPRTVGSPELTLQELWLSTGAAFDARRATTTNGVDPTDVDPQ